MDQFLKTPLPYNFYVARGWLGSMLTYYADERHYMPRDVLSGPLKGLAMAIQLVTEVYGNFPETMYKFLRQAVDPLYEPGEYDKKVYKSLIDISKKEGEPNLKEMAEALRFIRRQFERDSALIEQYYTEQVNLLEGKSYEEKRAKFAEVMKGIVKVHVIQVSKMIKSRREK